MERTKRKVYKGDKLTEAEWELIDLAVRAFISKFHTQWALFKQEMAMERAQLSNPRFGDANKKEHKELNWRGHRQIAVIPTFWNEVLEQQESLIMVLEKIAPYLFSTKTNTMEFLKRYPDFKLPEEL